MRLNVADRSDKRLIILVLKSDTPKSPFKALTRCEWICEVTSAAVNSNASATVKIHIAARIVINRRKVESVGDFLLIVRRSECVADPGRTFAKMSIDVFAGRNIRVVDSDIVRVKDMARCALSIYEEFELTRLSVKDHVRVAGFK